jgi:phenylacetate-CoA ligase
MSTDADAERSPSSQEPPGSRVRFSAVDPGAPDSRLERLNALLELVGQSNEFQRGRLGQTRLDSLDQLVELPFTSKDDLLADQAENPPFGTNLTYEVERYTHLHHTSGTTGATLRVLDTAEDWAWWRNRFGRVLTAAGVGPGDRVALAYSFGPYIQFWASYEGAQEVGAMVIPMGGMDSIPRLETIREYRATTLLCTPSYAVHLARVGLENDLTDAFTSVERLVCTGEPGASLPSVREQIESLWGARCFDHAGLSEVGSLALPCDAGGGVHLQEDEFICEVLDAESGEPVADGGMGELVVTALGRTGFPVIRYRTGDVVEKEPRECPAGHPGRWLPQGILGRTDDMVVIRGMNVFPSAIEQILREWDGIGEFRITFYNDPRAMDEVKVEAELARPSDARPIQTRMRQRLGLRVRIVPLKRGILPPQVGKARRVEDLRPDRTRPLTPVGDG